MRRGGFALNGVEGVGLIRRVFNYEPLNNMIRSLRISICPVCGGERIKKVRRDLIGKFAGRSYAVPSLEFYECPDCGEKVYDREAMRKIEARSPAFKRPRTRKVAVG
jgi:YgiT-type zinc finger domain-containing protein